MEFKGDFRLGVVWATLGAVIGFLGGGALLTILGAAYGGADGGQFGMIGFLVGPPVGFFLGWRLAAKRFMTGALAEPETGHETNERNPPGHEERWVWTLTGIPIGGILGCVFVAVSIHILARLHFTNPWNDAWMRPFSWVGLLLGLTEGAFVGWFLAGLRSRGSHEPPTGNSPSVKGMIKRVSYTLIILLGIIAVPYVLALVNLYLYVGAGLFTVLLTALWTGRYKTLGLDNPSTEKRERFHPGWPYLIGIGEILFSGIVFMMLLRFGLYGMRTPLLYLLCLSVFPVFNASREKSLLVRGNIMGVAVLVGVRVLMLMIWMVSLALGYGSVP